MHAYNERELCNKYVHEQATEALRTACISQESYKNILQAHPSKLYTPNYFIRIAMGLLTVVSVLFSGLLLWLFTSASSDAAITTVLVFLAVICYIALELLVKVKQYFNAGVDNILMCMVIAFVVSAFFISDQDSLLIISCVIMIITLWLSIRFTDAFMSVVCYCCFFVFVFMAYIKAGEFAMATASLMMMAVSAIVYLLMKKLAGSTTFKYQFCFNSVTFFTLVTFYASGNYFIVKELSNQMFHLTPNNPLPFGWLFWIFTLIIPPAYIIYGIIKKDLLLIRTGLGLIGATIFTLKYYYTVLPTEIEMLTAGILLIGLSYALINNLIISKHGYTSKNIYGPGNEILNAEALIIAETFNKNPTKENQGLYGGGTGGGGGATGEY